MKKILSLILAIVMVASFALAVSADEIKVVDASCPEGTNVNEKPAVDSVTKKYFAASYTMTLKDLAGNAGDNGVCGLVIGDNWQGVIAFTYDGDKDGKKGCDGQLRFGPWWGDQCKFGTARFGDASEFVGKEVTLLILGEVNDGTLTLKAYVNGVQQKTWGDKDVATLENFGGQIGYVSKLAGEKMTYKFVQSDTELGLDVFDEKQPENPVVPKTGEATAFVALVSVLALAGVVVATKKR